MNFQEGYYSKIPNRLVVKTEDNQSIVREIDEKVILIWDYLYNNTNRLGIVRFTLEDLIESCGYKTNNRAGQINDKFRDILRKMKVHNLLEELILNKKVNKISTAKIIDLDNNYFNLYMSEKELLLKEKDNLNLLKVYCLIKARIYRRQKGESFTSYGKAEVCFVSYEDITLNTGVANAKEYIDKLVKLDLIRYKNAGIKIDKITGTKQYSRNTYALYKEDWENEIDLSIKIYKNANKERYNFIKVDNKFDKRKIGGEKGYLLRKIKEGKASKKDKARLEYIENILDAKQNTLEEYYETVRKEIVNLCKIIIERNIESKEYIRESILHNNIDLDKLKLEQLQEIREQLIDYFYNF